MACSRARCFWVQKDTQLAEAETFQFPNASLKSGHEESLKSKNPSQGFCIWATRIRYFTHTLLLEFLVPVISSFQFLNWFVLYMH